MFAEMCTDLVDIYSDAKTPDAAGGAVTATTLVASSVPCSIQYSGGDRALVHAIENQVIEHDVYFVADYSIRVGWRLNVTGTARWLFVKVGGANEPGQSEVFWVHCEERS